MKKRTIIAGAISTATVVGGVSIFRYFSDMAVARKQPKISNYEIIEALLYMVENGCKCRALPKKYGKWHTIYMRFSRWCEKGIVQKIFLKLQVIDSQYLK